MMSEDNESDWSELAEPDNLATPERPWQSLLAEPDEAEQARVRAKMEAELEAHQRLRDLQLMRIDESLQECRAAMQDYRYADAAHWWCHRFDFARSGEIPEHPKKTALPDPVCPLCGDETIKDVRRHISRTSSSCLEGKLAYWYLDVAIAMLGRQQRANIPPAIGIACGLCSRVWTSESTIEAKMTVCNHPEKARDRHHRNKWACLSFQESMGLRRLARETAFLPTRYLRVGSSVGAVELMQQAGQDEKSFDVSLATIVRGVFFDPELPQQWRWLQDHPTAKGGRSRWIEVPEGAALHRQWRKYFARYEREDAMFPSEDPTETRQASACDWDRVLPLIAGGLCAACERAIRDDITGSDKTIDACRTFVGELAEIACPPTSLSGMSTKRRQHLSQLIRRTGYKCSREGSAVGQQIRQRWRRLEL